MNDANVGRWSQAPAVVQLDAPPSARDIRDATLIKEGDVFLLTDLEGNAPIGNSNGYGLYYGDTRFLSGYELAIAGLRPTVLLSSTRSQFMSAQVLTNPNLVLADGRAVTEQTIQVRRYRVIRGAEISESLALQNLNAFAIDLDVELRFAADFYDMFEVRGIVQSARRGVAEPASFDGERLRFRYHGRDDLLRVTEIAFDPTPEASEPGTARYALHLAPGESKRIAIVVRISEQHRDEAPRAPRGEATLVGYRRTMAEQATIETSNELFNAILRQSRLDLRLLLGGTKEEPFVCAGIPWYATLFGRDCLITAMQDLWLTPMLARSTLKLLARYQGTRDDDERDEEPGKIMHELRRGELARIGTIPFGPYYGTIDATLLWIRLLADYFRTTGDLELVRELRANLEAALAWIDRSGDLDGDGFVEYRCRSRKGLVNQGWKDSTDGIVHADGSLPVAPIALVEVQAYLYAAYRGAASLFDALGELARATELALRAQTLRDAFERAFYMPSEGFYATALDGAKRQVASISSNAGHALLCGIVSAERGEAVARRLMAEDVYSGFGIRTLSMREARYNPAGYHLGTIWPHDNALIALGFKRYGQETLLTELFTGLYDAAPHFPGLRTPELFCGFARTAFGVPVRYPVACSPQAWAASAWSALLQATLGIMPVASRRELRICRPSLPAWLQWVDVRGLSVGTGRIDLRYERVGDHTAVDVRAMHGDVRVALVGAWDPDDVAPALSP